MKIKVLVIVSMFLVSLFTSVCGADETVAVDNVLESFHDAASKHDGKRYFGHMSDDAIFLGTDATERWTVEQFKGYAMPYFNSGKGWTYTKTSRYIYLSEKKDIAWFDEALKNEKYGVCRGSGVLKKIGGEWKIVQYNLAFPVPNKVAKAVVEMIRVVSE